MKTQKGITGKAVLFL